MGKWLPTALLVVVAVVILMGILRIAQEKTQAWTTPEVRGDAEERNQSDTVLIYNGVAYRLRNKITTVLVMGIDDGGKIPSSKYRAGGQADFLRLIIFDDENKTLAQVAIDRDTITPITVLGISGKPSGKRDDHISLSHSFGQGGADSCLLTVKAVSELLANLPIDHFIALDVDGVAVLNDALGGVPVTVQQDLTAWDASWVPGAQITLYGDQAEEFVRGRMSVGNGTNAERMSRQEQYMAAAYDIVMQKQKEDGTFTTSLYNDMKDYMTMSASRGLLVNRLSTLNRYTKLETRTLPGEHSIDAGGFTQFIVDKAGMVDMILELCYEII